MAKPEKFDQAKVYPRVCGGATIGSKVTEGVPGLSPRVRGSPEKG